MAAAGASPDRAIVTACHSQRLLGVQGQGPELAFAMALEDEYRLIPLAHNHFKNLAVLGPCQEAVGLPAYAPDRQAWWKKTQRPFTRSTLILGLSQHLRCHQDALSSDATRV